VENKLSNRASTTALYRHAFHMCARAGVPHYTTLKLGGMKSHRVYNVGQSFLFLAALFAFTWSYMIARYIAELKATKLKDVPKKKRGP
jgi:hypothetical protein